MEMISDAKLAGRASEDLAEIRKRTPLIHNITNYVVMNFTANVLLSMGASPVMAHAEEEVEEMVGLANALVLNIGTLSESWIRAMIRAGKKASELEIPIVLDPVGSGATALRTDTSRKIIGEADISIIRGNASEILSLENGDSKTRGVDTVHSVEDAAESAGGLAKELKAVLAITGPEDLVTDGERSLVISNGDSQLTRITGTGCAATSVIGAFSSVDPDPVTAAAAALSFTGLAGERAAEKATAPGSFMVAFLDALYTITPEELACGSRIRSI